MPVEIFCCYAHHDEALLNKLKTHLSPLQREGLIDVWHDRNISAGKEWGSEISEHLNTADIILLLVSPDFMASEYCYSVEMKRAIERHDREEARVIPIILEHVYWQITPLKKLQALPTDARPIVSKSWHNRNEAFLDVVKGLRKAVEELSARTNLEQLYSKVVGERYELQDTIGKGYQTTVYRGYDRLKNRSVAIKISQPLFSSDQENVKRFGLQIMALRSLNHPNIVRIYDYGQQGDVYFIVMELIEGKNLKRYLHSREVLDTDKAIVIAHDVALGLGLAHQYHIVHRDVKPEHILIGKGGCVKLAGFAIVSLYQDQNDERLTPPEMTVGTIQYHAPEQAQGNIVTPAADVYSLGIVMYQMLTGQLPFQGKTPVEVAIHHIHTPPIPPSKLNPKIPPKIEDIILRCMEKAPEKRYAHGWELAKVLSELSEIDVSSTP